MWNAFRGDVYKRQGKAALEGFRDVDGVSIGVMYPDGGVSDIQFKQMATQRGRNVQVLSLIHISSFMTWAR